MIEALAQPVSETRAPPGGGPPQPRADGPEASFFQCSPDALVVLDPADARVLDANPAACELFGYPRDGFVGVALNDLSDGAPPLPEYVRRAARGESCRRALATHMRRDGGVVRVEVSAAAVGHLGRRAVLAALRDITDRELVETRLRQTAKMEAIGQMAGGIAHDFNNLLTVINGYADVLIANLPPRDSSVSLVSEIRTAGHRAADLTRQILAFSRKQAITPQSVRLGNLLQNLRKMLARLIGEQIRLVTVASPNLRCVKADSGQLEQVLINLAVNARDAMPKGGTLVIECRNLIEPGGECRFVRVTVTDTGTGMPDEVKARIFEPFFTTKEVGKGTGLGLATVLSIVQQSGGQVGVESTVGVGTTFRVDLPVAESSAVPEAPHATREVPRGGGSETVLLVEDEGAVRMMALHALQANGYSVLDAEDGEQALRVTQTFGVPIQLLITDVVMPGMSGRTLAERLQTVQPTLKVLYISGYSDEELARNGVDPAQFPLLQKPFTPHALLDRVRAVLDADRAPAAAE